MGKKKVKEKKIVQLKLEQIHLSVIVDGVDETKKYSKHILRGNKDETEKTHE